MNDEELKPGIIVWKKNIDKPEKQILILVEAKSVYLTENLDQAWTEVFGNTYDKYYQHFNNQLNAKRFSADMSQHLKLVDE